MTLYTKHIFKSLLLLVFLGFIGCSKDESNADIIPINTIGISDPLALTTITIFQGDTLKLKPQLTLSMKENIDKLEFSWLVYNSNGNISLASPRAKISDKYELKYPIVGDLFVLGEPYIVRLAVKDIPSGVSSFINYKVNIGNKYGNGWLILEDKAGKGDMSFIFPDSSVEHNLYSSRNTAVITGPKKLELTPFTITDDISAVGKRLYILADNGSQEYNYLTMVKKFDYSFEFFIPPTIQKPQVMTWLSATAGASKLANIGIVINNGKAHSNLVGGFPGVKKWGDIALNELGNANYNLAPYTSGGPNVAAMVYDNTAQRFYSIVAFSPTPGAGSLTPFPANASTPAFDMNNVGMTMIFHDSSDVVHNYNAVMKSGNDAYLLKYKTVNTSTATPNLSVSKTLMNAPGILNYTAAASSTNTGHIYYSNSNVISRYETGSNTIVESYAFPANEQVTAMKYAKYNFNDKDAVKKARLVVATWNGTEGKLYYFAISQTGSMGAFTKQFTGFAKIVDVAYKY